MRLFTLKIADIAKIKQSKTPELSAAVIIPPRVWLPVAALNSGVFEKGILKGRSSLSGVWGSAPH
jgi:hypothetical protein